MKVDDLVKSEILLRDLNAEHYETIHRRFDRHLMIERMTPIWVLNPQPNDVVLDAGCGIGWLTMILAKKCKQVIAMDYSAKSIEILKKKIYASGLDNIECFVEDITEPNVLNGYAVDKVLSVQVFQHIPTTKLREQAINNIYSCLRPNGQFVATNHNAYQKIMRNFLHPIRTEMITKDYYGQHTKGLFCKDFFPCEILRLCRKFRRVFIGGTVNLWFMRQPWLPRIDMMLSCNRLSRFSGCYLLLNALK